MNVVAHPQHDPGWWLASDGQWYPPHLAPGQPQDSSRTLATAALRGAVIPVLWIVALVLLIAPWPSDSIDEFFDHHDGWWDWLQPVLRLLILTIFAILVIATILGLRAPNRKQRMAAWGGCLLSFTMLDAAAATALWIISFSGEERTLDEGGGGTVVTFLMALILIWLGICTLTIAVALLVGAVRRRTPESHEQV